MEGLSVPSAIAPESAADQSLRQRQKLARTVGIIAALALIALALVITLFLQRFGLGILAVFVGGPLGYAAYLAVSMAPVRWERIAFLARWLPPLGALIDEQRRRQEIEAVIVEMEYVMTFYRLGVQFAPGQVTSTPEGSLSFDPPLRAALLDAIAGPVQLQAWPKALISRLATENPGWREGPGAVSDLLLAFYDERREELNRASWARIARDPATIRLAAEWLLGSDKLPRAAEESSLGPEDLAAMLAGISRFDLDLVRRRVARLNSLAGRAAEYLVFLDKNGVSPDPSPPAMSLFLEILERTAGADGFNPGFHEVDAAVLVEIGRRSLRGRATENPDDRTDAMVDRYARLGAVLFLTRGFPRDPTLELLCKQLAADPESVTIAWAYLDLKEDLRSEHRLGGRPFLSLAHLIENWREKVAAVSGNSEIVKEISQLTEVLQKGEWVAHLSDLLEEGHKARLKKIVDPDPTPGPHLERPREELAQRALEKLQFDQRTDLLRRLFRGLDFDAIERNLETRRFTPYLITFSTGSGPLARLVNCLTSEEKLVEAGVTTLRVADRPKYNFRPYTENTRIGLVPTGWTFEEFRKAFQQDLERVLEHRRDLINHDWEKSDLEGVEVMLHRFEAVGRNHYPFRSAFSRHIALGNIKDLLAENLEPAELLTVVQYGLGEDLRDRILDSAIPDVVGEAVKLRPVERAELREVDGLVKGELLDRVGAPSIPDLGRGLVGGRIDVGRTETDLAEIIQQRVPRFTLRRSRRIASAYLSGVQSAA